MTQQSHAANRTPYSAPQLHPAPCECTPAQVLGAEPSTLARLLCQPDSTVLVLAATASSNLHHNSGRVGLLPPPRSSHSAYGCRTSLQDSYRILHLVHPLSAVAVRSSAAFVFEGSASGSQKTPHPVTAFPHANPLSFLCLRILLLFTHSSRRGCSILEAPHVVDPEEGCSR